MIDRSLITERIKKGAIINKLDYQEQLDELQPSESYEFLINNYDIVKNELKRSGMKLIHNPTEGYYYASRNSVDNASIFFSLIAITQAAYNTLESVEAICDPKIGVSLNELTTQRDVSKNENKLTTLVSTRELMLNLLDKGFVYANRHDKIVITTSGLSMVESHLDI